VQRSPEIEQLLADLNSKMEAGDTQAIIDAHSREDDTLVIGTDREEWVQGRARLERLWQAQPPMPAARVDDLQAYEEGSIGWFSCKITIEGDAPLSMRATGVLRKEDGRWKFVQSHASVARQQ
jgi:ketosteroid isomerase-like protein